MPNKGRIFHDRYIKTDMDYKVWLIPKGWPFVIVVLLVTIPIFIFTLNITYVFSK